VLSLLILGHTAWMSTITGPRKHELAAALEDHPGLRDAFARFFDGLRTLVVQGQARGEIDPAIPAPVAVRFLLSLVRAQGGPGPRDAAAVSGEDFAALAVRLLFHGLAAHPLKESSA
ncbi:MAG: hypothetical protein ACRDG4_04185, partial [Chloroflexota bacterium]